MVTITIEIQRAVFQTTDDENIIVEGTRKQIRKAAELFTVDKANMDFPNIYTIPFTCEDAMKIIRNNQYRLDM